MFHSLYDIRYRTDISHQSFIANGSLFALKKVFVQFVNFHYAMPTCKSSASPGGGKHLIVIKNSALTLKLSSL